MVSDLEIDTAINVRKFTRSRLSLMELCLHRAAKSASATTRIDVSELRTDSGAETAAHSDAITVFDNLDIPQNER